MQGPQLPRSASPAPGVRSIGARHDDNVAGRSDAGAGQCSRPQMRRSINEEIPGSYSGDSLETTLEHSMATPAPRKRKAAAPQNERTVKTSVVMGASLHLQLAAAAALQGTDKNALVVEILTEALRGIV